MRIPSYDEVAQLPVHQTHVVGEEHIDVNGHMNITHYFGFAGHAMWRRNETLGMPASYIADRGLTTFTAEQHLRYVGESVLGDTLQVSVVVVDRGDKSLHLAALVVNETRRELSCVMEAVAVHVDYASRRPVPFPADVAALLDDAVAGDRPGWPLPLSGSLGVRRT